MLTILDKLFAQNQVKIEAWFQQQWANTPPPISSSVDLRNSGFKLAPVDTNLFPAGFNNLSSKFFPQSIQAAKLLVTEVLPECKNILLITESHTRNQFYFESVTTLREILLAAGYGVRVGSLALTTPQEITLQDGKSLLLEPVVRHGDYLEVKDFLPCLIFLNNDLSEGNPEILRNLLQPVKPPPQLGWHSRLKTNHFKLYDNVCGEFAKLLDCDPWLFNPMFAECNAVNFMLNLGTEELMQKTAEILAAIQQKYLEYNVPHQPFVVIKSNAGTYGMAVLTVKSVDELANLNRSKRKRMTYIKGNREVDQVIIQEGVYTFETCGDAQVVAEPVVYMLGQYVIGGFYRVHAERGEDENLNTPGMQFESMPFADSCINAYHDLDHSDHADCFYSYGVIARLALLAAAQELAEVVEF